MGTGMAGGMSFMWVFWLFLVVGVVLVVAMAARAFTGAIGQRDHSGARAPGPTGARAVLDERYARGELSTEEYQDRLRVLGAAS